jgi:serine phosphatase RsbU (regulator of sigma subunit)
VAIIEADVADKGVGAALYMALSRAYLRSQAIGSDPSPAQALAALNRRILQDTTSDLFETVFYALVTPDGRELVYANAGHPPPIIVRADPSRASLTLPRTGMAVGVLEDTGWEQISVDLEPGDFVVIYSDGMTDSMNPQGEMYGAARIKAEAEALRGYPPVEVRKRLMDAFQAFASSGQEDDVTLLVLGKD